MQEIQTEATILMFGDTETIQNNQTTRKNFPSNWKPARLLNDPIYGKKIEFDTFGKKN